MKLRPSLVGPTCSGKTGVAIDVARDIGVEVLSADSRQIYRGLDIGTAKPSPEQCAACPHHLIDIVEPRETYTAARFGRDARAVADEVVARGRVPLLVGGSGLYVRAAEEGLFEGPAADPELRTRLEREADEAGDVALHARLRSVDPPVARRLHPSDRVRVIRALEVHELTGLPLSEHHRRHAEVTREGGTLRFGITWPSIVLERRITERIVGMIEAGWVHEVEGLLGEGVPRDAPALNALGYPEILRHLDGELSIEEAKQHIVFATRRFAKRQRTWFRAVENITWFPVRSSEELARVAPRIAEALRRETP